MPYHANLARMFELQKFGMKFGLDSMKQLLKNLKNPHDGSLYVHVAGTNGKGSVVTMLSNVLKKAGYRAGAYTSPHLITFRERIKIDGEMISEHDVLKMAQEIWPACDPQALPTFFEFVTAMAFMYFKRQDLDLAIIETGLGGRLDSTNVIDPMITAITNVSLDHTEYLGQTITHIAHEKAGIIKPNRHFIGGQMVDEAAKVIQNKVKEVGAHGCFCGKDFKIKLVGCDSRKHPLFDYAGRMWNFKEVHCGLPGRHQIENAAVVLNILEVLAKSGFKINEDHIREGLSTAKWPGRIEFFEPGTWPPDGPKAQFPLVLDGAHNPAGAKALAAALTNKTWNKLHLILGVMADKDIGGILGPILKLADRLYLTRPEFHRAATPEMLHEKLVTAFGQPKVPVEQYPTLQEAIRNAAKNAKVGDMVLVTGSLFTVGEARAYLLGYHSVESN